MLKTFELNLKINLHPTEMNLIQIPDSDLTFLFYASLCIRFPDYETFCFQVNALSTELFDFLLSWYLLLNTAIKLYLDFRNHIGETSYRKVESSCQAFFTCFHTSFVLSIIVVFIQLIFEHSVNNHVCLKNRNVLELVQEERKG